MEECQPCLLLWRRQIRTRITQVSGFKQEKVARKSHHRKLGKDLVLERTLTGMEFIQCNADQITKVKVHANDLGWEISGTLV